MSSQIPLHPTFQGLVASTFDSLLLFEACLSGQLTQVPRRPYDQERQDLIKSSNVFIYEEHASGIKRWTDGISWSPSRILGNFLIYRELEKPFPPIGQKKRALKKKICPPRAIAKAASIGMDKAAIKDTDKALIRSRIDSHPFKPGGLVKKTITINFQGVSHHLVSYYNLDDVSAGHLSTPSRSFKFLNISPRTELFTCLRFRIPVGEAQYSSDVPQGIMSFCTLNTVQFLATDGLFPYEYHPLDLVAVNSSTQLQVPQLLPYSILPSNGPSALQSVSSISRVVPSSKPPIPMPYTPNHGESFISI